MKDQDLRVCPICEKEVPRNEMDFTRDCHGITMRLACFDCINKIMEDPGYDGIYYDEFDEQIEDDY